jgi:RNA polymerase sigma-70 factor (ECF subfamily)
MAAAFTSDRYWLQERLTAHDSAAFAEIYDHGAPIIFGVALRVTADRQAADDITEEILLEWWRRPDGLERDVGNLAPWLASVSHRRSVSWKRAEQAAWAPA